MEAVYKKNVWNFILIFIHIHLARCQVELTHNSASASADTFICGENTKFTCVIDPAPVLMSWVKDSSPLTDCPGSLDACVDAIKDNYQFTSNFTVKEFYLTVNPVMFSNAGTFTCSIGASVEDSKTISIAAVPSAIAMTQESGTGTVTLQATTDCAYPMSNVSIEWYYLEELTDTPQLYTDNGFTPVRTEDSSTCTSGDCTSGVGVSKVVSTVTFVEKGSGGTSAYLQAKMKHSAAPSSSPAVVATTTNTYIIIEASTPEPDCCFCMRRCTVHKPAVCNILCILIIVVILGSGIPPGMAFEAIFGIWEDMSKTKRILSFFALLFGLGLFLCDLIRKKCAGSTTTLTVVEGSKVTFSCPFPESVTFPEWRGPPGLTIYTILDDTSGTINSKIPAFNRLQYASNKRDLILSNAVIGDSGDYKCSYTGQGDHTFTLKVIRGKGDKACNDVNTGSHPNEKKKQGRPQPPPPGANHREGSGSVVSGRDVEMQETDTSLNRRQLPDIHDRKGRGLSANYTDDDHPLVSINIPTKKPGALESIPDSAREEVTKKKKKKKKKVTKIEDDQSD